MMNKQRNLTSIPLSLLLISIFMMLGIDLAVAADPNALILTSDWVFYLLITAGPCLALLGFLKKSKS